MLGYQRDKCFSLSLRVVRAGGGEIPCIRIVVERQYPPQSSIKMGATGARKTCNEKAEVKMQRLFEAQRERRVAEIREEIGAKMGISIDGDGFSFEGMNDDEIYSEGMYRQKIEEFQNKVSSAIQSDLSLSFDIASFVTCRVRNVHPDGRVTFVVFPVGIIVFVSEKKENFLSCLGKVTKSAF